MNRQSWRGERQDNNTQWKRGIINEHAGRQRMVVIDQTWRHDDRERAISPAVDDVRGNGRGNEGTCACKIRQFVALCDGREQKPNQVHSRTYER